MIKRGKGRGTRQGEVWVYLREMTKFFVKCARTDYGNVFSHFVTNYNSKNYADAFYTHVRVQEIDMRWTESKKQTQETESLLNEWNRIPEAEEGRKTSEGWAASAHTRIVRLSPGVVVKIIYESQCNTSSQEIASGFAVACAVTIEQSRVANGVLLTPSNLDSFSDELSHYTSRSCPDALMCPSFDSISPFRVALVIDNSRTVYFEWTSSRKPIFIYPSDWLAWVA